MVTKSLLRELLSIIDMSELQDVTVKKVKE